MNRKKNVFKNKISRKTTKTIEKHIAENKKHYSW